MDWGLVGIISVASGTGKMEVLKSLSQLQNFNFCCPKDAMKNNRKGTVRGYSCRQAAKGPLCTVEKKVLQ